MTYEEREALIKAAEKSGPVVGMPCTYNIGSDHYAAKVTYVSPSKAWIMVDHGSRGESERFNRGRDGRYRGKGRSGSITLGVAKTDLDPSF